MSHLGNLEGEQSYLVDLLTMVIHHLLDGMILQAPAPPPFSIQFKGAGGPPDTTHKARKPSLRSPGRKFAPETYIHGNGIYLPTWMVGFYGKNVGK